MGHVRIFGWDDSPMPDGTVALYTQPFRSKTLPASVLPPASFTMAPTVVLFFIQPATELGSTALGRMDPVSGLLELGDFCFLGIHHS